MRELLKMSGTLARGLTTTRISTELVVSSHGREEVYFASLMGEVNAFRKKRNAV
jgi:hypothetical protein